jgi:hypothetical protein
MLQSAAPFSEFFSRESVEINELGLTKEWVIPKRYAMFSPAWDAVKPTLEFGFTCLFLVIEPAD